MNGGDLRLARRAAGLSQAALARRAGVGRHAVSYWECRERPDPKAWAVKRMLTELGLTDLPYFFTQATCARACANTVLDTGRDKSRQAHVGARACSSAPLPARCGAVRKNGKPCRHKVEPDKKRCKFHGGCSTGPRTAEGRARIAEAQRRRWAESQQDRVSMHTRQHPTQAIAKALSLIESPVQE